MVFKEFKYIILTRKILKKFLESRINFLFYKLFFLLKWIFII
jgi:hypothetical protein